MECIGFEAEETDGGGEGGGGIGEDLDELSGRFGLAELAGGALEEAEAGGAVSGEEIQVTV